MSLRSLRMDLAKYVICRVKSVGFDEAKPCCVDGVYQTCFCPFVLLFTDAHELRREDDI